MVDHNMSPRLARAINILVEPLHRVEHLRDKFPTSTSDTEWIRQLSSEGEWVVFTLDNNIHRRPHELRELNKSNLRVCFFLSAWSGKTPIERTYRILKRWDEIVELVEASRPSTSLLIPIQGAIRRNVR